MTKIPLKDAAGQQFNARVHAVDDHGEQQILQAVVVADPETGDPVAPARESTLFALKSAALAIQQAAEFIAGRTTAINTGAVAGTVDLGAATLAALENINANTGLAQPLTDEQLRAFPLALPENAASEATLSQVRVAVEAVSAALYNTGDVFTVGDNGIIALAKRRDADTATVGDGEYTTLNMDEEGRLKVAVKAASYSSVVQSITASGGIASIPCGRFCNLSVSMVAASLVGHNVSFECSNNSTNGSNGNWYGVQAVRSNANTVESTSGVLAATPAYMWHVNVGDYSYFRVRATAHTSGTAAYTLKPGSFATEPIPAVQVTGTQPVSFTQPALVAGTARIGSVAGAGIWFDDSATTLAASASFTGSSRDLTVTATATAFANAATYAKELRGSAESDQAGTLWLEVSRDGTNWRRVKSVATAAVTGGGQYAEIIHRPSWRYARFGFTNGATAQTRFALGSIAVAL